MGRGLRTGGRLAASRTLYSGPSSSSITTPPFSLPPSPRARRGEGDTAERPPVAGANGGKEGGLEEDEGQQQQQEDDEE